MANLNKVMLIGNLGKDSELRYSQNGSPFLTFSLAVNKAYKNANGDKIEKTTWINVVLFGKTAESLHQYLTKGKQVYIEGELNIERYTDKDGAERYGTRVIGRNIQFIGGKKEGDADLQEQGNNAESEQNVQADEELAGEDMPF
ncbi:MAG: single-stranded DNA-binding protein [bacterium]